MMRLPRFEYHAPGTVAEAAGLLAENPNPSEDEIRHGIEGNLCRCTGYHNIVRSIEFAAATLRGEEPAPPDWTLDFEGAQS